MHLLVGTTLLFVKMNGFRIESLDIAKAICIVLVVVGHYIPDNSPIWYVVLHDVIYTFHMPLFMFASGFIYMATKKDMGYGVFIQKKVQRLLIPYFATSVVIISIKLLTQGDMSVDNPVDIMSYLRMFYLPEAGYFLWFIWALWWMFVIVGLLKTPKARMSFLLVSIILHYLPFDFLPKVFCVEQCANMMVFFMLGVFVCENKRCLKFVMEYRHYKVAVSLLLFIAIQTLFQLYGKEGNDTLLNVLPPYIGIFFVLEMSKFVCRQVDKNRRRFLTTISMASYIIYLLHTTFEGFAKALFMKFSFNSDLWYVFVMEAFVVILVGTLAPILLNKYVLSRYRITRFLFGW